MEYNERSANFNVVTIRDKDGASVTGTAMSNTDNASNIVKTLADYQRLAARTINTDLSKPDQGKHALFGMCSEIGELQSLYQ